jgi:glycosyltransferase involved in cell wall biosynthesis
MRFSWPGKRRSTLRVSVIIPTYNRARSLAALLKCLEAQTAADSLQVVVCDDGSSDDTRAAALSFATGIRLSYLYQPDQGFRAGQARNMGLAAADGDIVIFIDDDQLVAPDFVDAHRRAHERHTAPSVVLGYRYRAGQHDGVPASAAAIRRFVADNRIGDLGRRARRLGQVESPWRYVYSCNMSLPRTAPDLRFENRFTGWGVEDNELGFRMVRSGLAVRFAYDAPALHLNDRTPRDPFEVERRGGIADYASYVRNVMRFCALHRGDSEVHDFARDQLSYIAFDEARGIWRRSPTRLHSPDSIDPFGPPFRAMPLDLAAD